VNLPVRLEDIRAQAWDALDGIDPRARDAAQFVYVDVLRTRVEAIPGVVSWLPEARRIALTPDDGAVSYATATALLDAAAATEVTPADRDLLALLVTGRAA